MRPLSLCAAALAWVSLPLSAQAGPTWLMSPPTVDGESASLSLFVGGISEEGATLKVSSIDVEVDGALAPAPKVMESFFDLAQRASEADPAWKSPLAVGLVYLWIKETPAGLSDAILEGAQGFFKRLPARTSAYATLYGRKRQPIPKLKASEIGGQLHDLGYLGGDRPNLGDAIAVNLKNLSADESLFKLLLVVTDGRDFTDPTGEGPGDFGAVGSALAKADVRLLLVSFPSPEADAEQSARNLNDLAGPGSFHRAVEQPMELQATLESLGQAIADLRRVQIDIPWAWRTLGGDHKVRILLTTDGKRRTIELGKITLPTQTGRLAWLGALGLGILMLPIGLLLFLRLRTGRRSEADEDPIIPATHALIRRGMSAQRALAELTRSFPESIAGLARVDESIFSDPRYPLLQTRAGRRRFEEIRALLTESDSEGSPLHDSLFAALAEAITAQTPARKAAESIAARLPDDQWGALARLGLEDLARALRQASKKFPVLGLPRSRGAVLDIQDALRAQTGSSLAVAWLVRARGPGRRGETLRLQAGRAVLGRAGACDLVLGGDAKVAEQHAVISDTRGEFAIEPVGGPIKVEDVHIEARHPLGDGDTVEIGQNRYIFKCVTTGNLGKSTGGLKRMNRRA
jgi:hypothetical protein